MISLFTSIIYYTLRSWKLKKTDFIANYNRMICNSANMFAPFMCMDAHDILLPGYLVNFAVRYLSLDGLASLL